MSETYDRKWAPLCEAIGDPETLCISKGRLTEPLRYRKPHCVLRDAVIAALRGALANEEVPHE